MRYVFNKLTIKLIIITSILAGIHIAKYKNKYHQLNVITDTITGNNIVPIKISINNINNVHNKYFIILNFKIPPRKVTRLLLLHIATINLYSQYNI